jgi:universal stress protein E
MIKNLLVIADQDASKTCALDKAREIAQPFDAKITVMAFISSKDNCEHADLFENTRVQLQDQLDGIKDLEHRVTADVIVTDDIVETLNSTCESLLIDVVIKTGHRSESFTYTPLDWHLIRDLKCPVLIASDQKWRDKPIVLATLDVEKDGIAQKKLNENVLKWSRMWCYTTHKSFKATYTIPVSEVLEDMDLVNAINVQNKKAPDAMKKITALLDAAALPNNEIHITAGKPEKEIPSYANKIKADLVIMGSVGRKGIEGFLLGNTAEKVLHNLHTDVLIVRPG